MSSPDASPPEVGDSGTRKLWQGFLRLQGVLLGALLLSMILVSLVNVVGRYLFSFSLTWSDEFTRLSLVVLTFLGAALAVAYRAHLVIDAIPSMMPAGSRQKMILNGVLHVASFTFFVMLLTGGWAFAMRNMGQASPAIGVPLGIVYMAVPVGAILMIMNYVGILVFGVGQLPRHDDMDGIEAGLAEARDLPP